MVFEVGDKVQVKVLKFNHESERVSLGLKQITDDPWTNAEEKYSPGTVVQGKVVSLKDYGAFIELEEGIEGLVHVSEMSWTRQIKNPKQMLDLGESELKRQIKTIGLFNTKARNVIRLSQQLLDDYGGEVPADRGDLEKLPGVGRKTANVVLNVAFGKPTFAVDTHVFRVGNRTGLAPGDKPLEVEIKLEKIVPQPYRLYAHHWLILHGRYICTARKPKCPVCIVRDLCAFKGKTLG